MSGAERHHAPASPLPPAGGDNPFSDPYAVPLTPAAPRPPFATYQSASTLPAAYLPPSPSSTSPRSPSSHPGLTPYLGLPTRLLLASLSPALLPIILTIVHLSTNRRSTADMADSLRSSMYAACTGLAKGAGTLQTIPRYMAMQTNEQMVRVTQGLIRATGMGLIHMVTIVEAVVIFVINTYRSLLVCTIELAVRGTLEMMIGAVRGAVTASLDEIRNTIQASISGANNVIQEAVSRLSRATSLIGIDISIPTFSIPELSRLSNVTIPNDFEQSLIRLNSSIPSLDELRTKLDSIISQPFSLLKAEMNETRLELAANFNSSLLPTPPMSSLSAESAREMEQALCGDLDTSLVDDTARALNKLSGIAIGLMCLLLFICWAALCIWDWYRWRCLRDSVETVEQEWKADGRADAWRAVAVIEHPVLEKYGSPALRRLARKDRTRRNVRWYLSYLAHPTTLTLLLISLLCLLSLQLQLVALSALKSHAQSNADAAVNASTASLTSKLNAMALEQSRKYASEYNEVVRGYQADMDERLIGKWVNTTGVALNGTLNEFYDDVEEIVNKAFGNTVLAQPMQTFLYCILGSKIDSLSRAVTWLRDNGRIELPLLPEDVLMLSPEAMNELAGPITAAAVGSSPSASTSANAQSSEGGAGVGGVEGDDGIVGRLIGHWEKAIKAEWTVYAILIGVWGVLALGGLVVLAWNSGPGDWVRSKMPPSATSTRAGGEGSEGQGEKYAVNMPGACGGYGSNEKAPIHDEYAHRFNGGGDDRPSHTRSGSGLSRLASLVGPADRFLKFGRQTPAPDSARHGERYDTAGTTTAAATGAGAGAAYRYGDKERLVTGYTSESYTHPSNQVQVSRHDSSYPYYNYNHHTSTSTQAANTARGAQRGVGPRESEIESPPAFWIKRAAGAALSPIRSFFPTGTGTGNGYGGEQDGFGSRGEKHGRAIHLRDDSGGYERMREHDDMRESEESERYDGREGRDDAAHVHAAHVGVALGGQEYRGTRDFDDYPTPYSPSQLQPYPSSEPPSSTPVAYSASANNARAQGGAGGMTFPRPLSRASTHYDGRPLNPFTIGSTSGDRVPAVPTMTSKPSVKGQGKHDSVDMLDQEQDGQEQEQERVGRWLNSGSGRVDPFADANEDVARMRMKALGGKGKRNPFAGMGRI